jgi:hypothetical protein
MVAIDQFLDELCPLIELSVFRTFFLSAYRYSFDIIFGTLLCHTKIQIEFEFGFDPLIFHKVMALGLRKILWISIHFPDFFSFCLRICIWYLVHRFAVPRYRSSLSLVLIHWFLTKLWPLDLENIMNYQFSRLFSLCLQYSFDVWYIALPYQDTDQVWVWFWFIDLSQSYGPWT